MLILVGKLDQIFGQVKYSQYPNAAPNMKKQVRANVTNLLDVGWFSAGGRRFMILSSTNLSEPSLENEIVCCLLER